MITPFMQDACYYLLANPDTRLSFNLIKYESSYESHRKTLQAARDFQSLMSQATLDQSNLTRSL